MREMPHDLHIRMAENIDGRGNSLEIFWQQFLTDAKARGAGLLLVDMPPQMASSLGQQIIERNAPYWTMILPESLTEWQIADNGKFVFAEFRGTLASAGGEQIECLWRFDAQNWQAMTSDGKRMLAHGSHPCGECPVLIWAETGEFPGFGPFAAIADLSRRIFNLESELDEILRSQTFSLLTMQVPDDSNGEQKLATAQVAGQTISTANLLVHTGGTPAFIAPPDGPARVYMDRIAEMRARIDGIGLNVAAVNQQESGIAMTMRFRQINAELVKAAVRTEDLERRAWDLSAKWLGMSATPKVKWSRDYQIADVMQELQILGEMQATAMPPAVILEQRRNVVAAQFGSAEQPVIDELTGSIDEMGRELQAA